MEGGAIVSAIECPYCRGPVSALGILGDVCWYRCRNCGAESSRIDRDPDPVEIDPAVYASYVGCSVQDARAILRQERADRRAHGGRCVTGGYDYDAQAWCACDYCRGYAFAGRLADGVAMGEGGAS
jgi:hypothetical protein